MSELFPVTFRGVDESVDPKAQPPGTLTRAENCRMDKARRLLKRGGTDPLVKTIIADGISPGAVALGLRLLTTGSDLALIDGDAVYAYASSAAKWAGIDRPPPWRATVTPLVDSSRSVTNCDIAIAGDVLVTIFLTGNDGPFLQASSLSTRQQLFAPFALGDASYGAPRVLIDGGVAYVFSSNAAGRVRGWKLTLATMALVGPTDLVTDAKANSPIDVVISAGYVYLAYEKSAGVNRTTIATFVEATWAVGAAQSYLGTSVIMYALDVGTNVYLAFTIGGTTKIMTLNLATLATIAGPTVLEAFTSNALFIVEDGANALCGWVRDDSNGTDADRFTSQYFNATTHAAVAASKRITFGVQAVTKPWKSHGRWFTEAVAYLHNYLANTDPIPSASSVVLEIEVTSSLSGATSATHPHVATLENQTGWYAPSLTTMRKASLDDDGNVYVPAAVRHIEPANATVQIAVGWNLYRLAMWEGDTFRGAHNGWGTLCAAAAPFWYDGFAAMPYGFAQAPMILSAGATVGGAMAVGTYSYVAVYVRRDSNGVIHRSRPSPPINATTAGANLSVTLKIATSSISSKERRLTGTLNASPVLIEIYRTTVGSSGPHYRLTYEPTYQVLLNNPRVGDVSIIDTKADADITTGTALVALSTQPELYTDTGELADDPPPSLLTCVVHQGRFVGIGPDKRTLHFSKDQTEDTGIAPGFHVSLTLAFATDKEALASLDDKLAVFGEDTIDVVFGSGPDATGNGAWQVQRVQSDIGCIDPRTPVTTPMGVVFQSARGIELLGRDLTVSWIGKAVEDTLALFPTITSAVLVASQHEVRFTCVSVDGTTGIVLAWDYFHNIWFTRIYKDVADTGAASILFIDAAMVDGVYTMLTVLGQVYQETFDHKLDGGTSYAELDVEIAWLSPSGSPMAWHRVKDVALMGTSVTPHQIDVSIGRDFAVAYEQVKAFADNTAVPAVGPLEKCRVFLKNQKARSVRVRVRDHAPAALAMGNGDGPILEGLAFRVQTKSSPAKTSAAEQG